MSNLGPRLSKRLKSARQENDGFTILELVIALGILALLIAISIPAYGNIKQQASDRAVKTDLINTATNLELFNQLNGRYATTGWSELEQALIISASNYDPKANYLYCSNGLRYAIQVSWPSGPQL